MILSYMIDTSYWGKIQPLFRVWFYLGYAQVVSVARKPRPSTDCFNWNDNLYLGLRGR